MSLVETFLNGDVMLRALPMLRPRIGRCEVRKVDKLSCIRFGSARYSVPCRLIGTQVTITTTATSLSVIAPVTGEVLAEHGLVGPGETSILDIHYDRPRPDKPNRAPRPRTRVRRTFVPSAPPRTRSRSARPPPGCPTSAAS